MKLQMSNERLLKKLPQGNGASQESKKTSHTLTGLFLDTGKIEEIKKYIPLGIVRGVTTNPTILVKDGVTGGWTGIEKHCKEIARLIQPLPLSVEVTTNDPETMLKQALQFANWARNINVKI